MAKNNKTRFFYVLYSDKTRVFDQSERAYYPVYITIKDNDNGLMETNASNLILPYKNFFRGSGYIAVFNYHSHFCRITNDRKTKLAAKTELNFANSQLEALKEELEGINSTLDVYQFDR